MVTLANQYQVFFDFRLADAHEMGLKVFEINGLRQIFHEGAEQAPFVRQLVFRQFMLRDVPVDAHQTDDLSVLIVQRKFAGQQPVFPAFVVQEMFLPVDDRVALNDPLVVGEKSFGMFARKEVEIGFSDGFGLGFEVKVFQVGEVGQRLPAGGILGIDGVRQVVDQCAQKAAFLVQRLFRLFPFCDVPAYAHQADGLSVPVAERQLARQQPAFPALIVQEIFLAVNDWLAVNHLLVVVVKLFSNLWWEEIIIGFADGVGFGFAAEVF